MSAKYTKFNVGDLVCLSAYGNARDYNSKHHGHWGIIIENQNPFNRHYPYKVEFLSKGKSNRTDVFHPRELKHFKPKKTDS